jgi:hypothetical protein
MRLHRSDTLSIPYRNPIDIQRLRRRRRQRGDQTKQIQKLTLESVGFGSGAGLIVCSDTIAVKRRMGHGKEH